MKKAFDTFLSPWGGKGSCAPSRLPAFAAAAAFALCLLCLPALAADKDTPNAKSSSKKTYDPRDPKQNPARLFGPNWKELPSKISDWDDGMPEDAIPKYRPPQTLRPSQRNDRRHSNIFWRTVSIAYALYYAIYLMPIFRFGAYRLTLFENLYRKEHILAGELLPFALRRARRAYRERNPLFWHPLATLPPGATIEIPSPIGGESVSGVIEERREYREPKNMRQWTLYILKAPIGADPDCLLVAPKNPGDWKRVQAWTGRLHASFSTDDAPFGWPPGPNLSILGPQGWPAEYTLCATSRPRAKLDPMNNEVEGIVRHIDDPPGRQYSARPATFWTYRAIPGQKHPPSFDRLDIFSIQSDGIFLETNPVPIRGIEFDLVLEGKSLSPIVPEDRR